ncbi:MAG TPA: hypothetical protein VE133_16905 [Candidatus Sulfotelmatobacter sp.]|nr:hypothetical protein [Candidatus Sulfotelmatobacter sp.]
MPYSAVRLFMVGSAILIADLPIRSLLNRPPDRNALFACHSLAGDHIGGCQTGWPLRNEAGQPPVLVWLSTTNDSFRSKIRGSNDPGNYPQNDESLDVLITAAPCSTPR